MKRQGGSRCIPGQPKDVAAAWKSERSWLIFIVRLACQILLLFSASGKGGGVKPCEARGDIARYLTLRLHRWRASLHSIYVRRLHMLRAEPEANQACRDPA